MPTDSVSRKGYLRTHWETGLPETESSKYFVSPMPNCPGEHDVDTVLHILLARLSGGNVFEGMCNPPGGDWSGVSIQYPDTQTEFRWISLPRVSGPETKRPDHVFQLFGISEKPIIFSIESKGTAQAVEKGIGPRLNGYLEYLFSSQASIEHPFDKVQWEHSTYSVDISDFTFASAAAFISTNLKQTQDAIKRAQTDLTFVMSFSNGGKRCEIYIWITSEIGRTIAVFLDGLDIPEKLISVEICG